MAISRVKGFLLAAGALGLAAAAVAQERPESLLPPGFGEPAPAPAPAPTPASTGMPAAPRAVATGALPPLPPLVLPTPTPSPTATFDPSLAYALPEFARRSLGSVGPTTAGFYADAFGTEDGRYLETLMRRLSAPLPSRWLSIALRRLLVSQVDTPARVNGADFAAERAWLLLRMGESLSARAVVQAVDTDNITPKLRQVWMQAALANADPGGLCPLTAQAGDSERAWVVARAMCAALTGTQRTQPLIQQIRRRRVASGIDLQLAQKVMGAGLDSRQAITVDWDPVIQLTTWRFGLAAATAASVPDTLYATVGPQVTGWRALAATIPLTDRVPAADAAAGMGVLSSAALVDLYAAVPELDEPPAAARSVAESLRDAYVGTDRKTRLDAMRRLWDGGEGARANYGRMVLTARAAGRLAVADGLEDTDRLVASMLSAGLDRTAQRWRGHVPEGGDAWAMLALADPDRVGGVGGIMGDYAPTGPAAQRKRQLFFAGVAGLGMIDSSAIERGAESYDVRIGAENAWTRAIDRAARRGEAGTVVLLAAAGMQTGGWGGVPAATLYRIVAGLRSVGLDGEARMIAAEAIARS